MYIDENEACAKALKIKCQGYNCAQSVLGALVDYIDMDKNTAFRIMTAFGGGMKHQQLCGALVGAGIALSFKFSPEDMSQYDQDVTDQVGDLTLDLVDRFKEDNQTSCCGELLDSDFSEFKWDTQIEGIDTNKENPYNIKAPICGKVITDAVKIAVDIINKADN